MSTDHVRNAQLTANEIVHVQVSECRWCSIDKIVNNVRLEKTETDWIEKDQFGDHLGIFLNNPRKTSGSVTKRIECYESIEQFDLPMAYERGFAYLIFLEDQFD
jgi:hypothetical protein